MFRSVAEHSLVNVIATTQPTRWRHLCGCWDLFSWWGFLFSVLRCASTLTRWYCSAREASFSTFHIRNYLQYCIDRRVSASRSMAADLQTTQQAAAACCGDGGQAAAACRGDGGQAAAACRGDGGADLWEALSRQGVPKALQRIVAFLTQMPHNPAHGPLDAVEFFAGSQRVCKALRKRGLRAVPFDRSTINDRMNMEDAHGFALACSLILSCAAGALVWFAPVCSSWVFINRATSGRSPLLPTGNQNLEYVRAGNMQASRVAALISLCNALGLTWILEQPRSSLMLYHPRLQEQMQMQTVFKANLCLGDFKAETLKPLYLLSNAPWIRDLTRWRRPPKFKFAVRTSQSRIDRSGRKRVDGISIALKNTQTYSRKFAREVARLYLVQRRKSGLLQSTLALSAPTTEVREALRWQSQDDRWLDADLNTVEDYLRKS